MKIFKFFYILATGLWAWFSVKLIGYVMGLEPFENIVIAGLLLIAVLLEEIYYMIAEKGGKLNVSSVQGL